MKNFSFLFLVIGFLFFNNLAFAQSSASCNGETVTAQPGAVSFSSSNITKVVLTTSNPYSYTEICNNSGNPTCSGNVTVAPGTYTIEIFVNWSNCNTSTIVIPSSGGGNINCSINTTKLSSNNCNNMGTSAASDDLFNPSFIPNNMTQGTYRVSNSQGTIQDNIPYNVAFIDPTQYAAGQTVQYILKNNDASCNSTITSTFTLPSECTTGSSNNGGSSCQQWTGDCNTTGDISRTGKVTVSRLDVTDIIHSKKVYVHLPSAFPDYVFEKDYDLMPLNQLESYIQNNKRLPNIPSAKVVAEEGIDVADLQAKKMEKIEELTLYILDLNKKVEHLEEENKKNQKKRFFKKRK